MIPLKPLSEDQRALAERRWRAPTKAKTAQAACDVGLFRDESKQTDLIDMLRKDDR